MEHNQEDSMGQSSVERFMEDLASERPTPGGGAACGVAGAMGAALVSMVCRVTRNKLKGEDPPEQMEQALRQADELCGLMLRGADDDRVAFRGLIDSYKLPKGSAEEVELRKTKIAAATSEATEVPLRCAEQARRIMELARNVADTGTPSVISDAGAASLAAYSALRMAALNVRINTKHSKNDAFREEAEKRISSYLDGAAELLEETYAVVSERM